MVGQMVKVGAAIVGMIGRANLIAERQTSSSRTKPTARTPEQIPAYLG
jgi:hypothetical protein